MTEIKNPKQGEERRGVIKNSAAIRFWSFGFRYCLGFRVSNLGFIHLTSKIVKFTIPECV